MGSVDSHSLIVFSCDFFFRREKRLKRHSKPRLAKKMNWQYQLARPRAKHLKWVMDFKTVQITGNPTYLDYLLKSKLK
jgi:hypothetical protein